MAAQGSKAGSTGMAPDRRPAIWPWLVMPFVTLSLFFALDKLHKAHGRDTPAFGSSIQSGPGGGPGDFTGH